MMIKKHILLIMCLAIFFINFLGGETPKEAEGPGEITQETQGKEVRLKGLYNTDSHKGKNNDPFSQSKFVPGISLILDFSYVSRNIDDDVFGALEVPGLIHGHGHSHEGHSHAAANAEKGFNLNYGELVFYAPVDPYFDLFTAFHLSEDSFEIEEAYITTRRLPLGFRLKAGKFLSGFGRINESHAHVWDFAELPLVHQAFFGDHGLLEKGIQLNWVAPTDFFLGLGIELLQGTNENSFGTEDFSLIAVDSAEEISLADVSLPNVWGLFAKTSIDFNDLVLLAGVSYTWGQSRLDHFSEEESPHGFAGDSRILGLDFTARYIIDSYRYLALQFEYLYRHMDGTLYQVDDSAKHLEGTDDLEAHVDETSYWVSNLPMGKKQDGWYAQLVFRFHKLWRSAFRWDHINRNDILVNGEGMMIPGNLNRYSLMVDFNPTEFSRIRLQYDINKHTYIEGEPQDYNRLTLQLNVAIGAHGAHPF